MALLVEKSGAAGNSNTLQSLWGCAPKFEPPE